MEQNFPVRASNALPALELQLCQSLDLTLALINLLSIYFVSEWPFLSFEDDPRVPFCQEGPCPGH